MSYTRTAGTARAVVAITLVAVALLAGAMTGFGSSTPSIPTPAMPTTEMPATAMPATAMPATGTPTAAPAAAVPMPGTTAAKVPPAARSLPAGACGPDARLTLRQALAQTLMVGVDGSSSAAVRALVHGKSRVGGIFVEGNATAALRSGVLVEVGRRKLPPLVAVDDEGGRVQRIDALVGDLPSAREQGQMDDAALGALMRRRGRALAGLGVTMDMAPVVDLGGQPRRAVIGDRSFATSAADVSRVTRSAGVVAAALRSVGVIPVLKHFPGHGRADGDSHLASVRTPSLARLRAADLLPYASLLGRGPGAVMVGHMEVPGLSTRDDSGRRLPASLDPASYRLLRTEYGFTGLAITDELSGMRAVRDRFTVPEAVEQALVAGADLALVTHPGSIPGLLRHLEDAVDDGRLPESRVRQAAGRVMAAKGCPA